MTNQGTERDSTLHGKGHGEGGRDKIIHALLGFLHRDTTPAVPLRGDTIVAMGVDPKWGRYAILPAAGAALRNVMVADQGDLEPTYKATLDATAPTTIAPSDAAAAGTSLIYSHRDHKHGTPATYPATAHNLLSATHGDTTAAAEADGALIAGIAGKWQLFAKPASASILRHDASNVVWDDGSWTAVAFNAGDFTASAGNWTVASGDVGTFAYKLLGKTMIVAFTINTSTVSATPATLSLLIPASKTAARTVVNSCQLLDNSVALAGYCNVSASGTTIIIHRSDGAAFAIATDTTYVQGQIVFETT